MPSKGRNYIPAYIKCQRLLNIIHITIILVNNLNKEVHNQSDISAINGIKSVQIPHNPLPPNHSYISFERVQSTPPPLPNKKDWQTQMVNL